MKFLLDENVSPNLRTALEKQQPELVVWAVGDPAAPSLSTLDPDLLVWCEEHGFVLVTHNRASMPKHLQDHLLAGQHVPGIFVVNSTLSIGEAAEQLKLVRDASRPGEYQDRIEWLPLK